MTITSRGVARPNRNPRHPKALFSFVDRLVGEAR
jgi:hypothetical protein